MNEPRIAEPGERFIFVAFHYPKINLSEGLALEVMHENHEFWEHRPNEALGISASEFMIVELSALRGVGVVRRKYCFAIDPGDDEIERLTENVVDLEITR